MQADLFGVESLQPDNRQMRKAEKLYQQLIAIYGTIENKCKNCIHSYRQAGGSKSYLKCEKSGHTAHGRSSDWNGNWKACGLFEKET